jgi:hypothetical protein
MLQGDMVMPCFIGVRVKITKKKHTRKISAENGYQTAYRTRFTEVVLNYMRCYMVLIYICYMVSVYISRTHQGRMRAAARLPFVTSSRQSLDRESLNSSKTYDLYT